MNKVIFFTLMTVVAFAGVVLYYNWHDKQVQDSLIQWFYTIFSAELATMGGIKVTKVVKERKIARDSIKRGTINRERRYEDYGEED